MKVVLEFLSQYGYILAYTALTAIAGVLGAGIKKLYDRMTADDTKRKVVETCVKAVEQPYQDLSGTEKLEKAKENIITMLDIKGISISEIEMDMLIEACVAEFTIEQGYYYLDGFYYICVDIGGLDGDVGPKITKCFFDSGKYEMTLVWRAYYDHESFRSVQIEAGLNEIDGHRMWTVYKVR